MGNEHAESLSSKALEHDLPTKRERPTVIDLGNGNPDPSTDPLVLQLAAIMMRHGEVRRVDVLPSEEDKEPDVLYYTSTRPRPEASSGS